MSGKRFDRGADPVIRARAEPIAQAPSVPPETREDREAAREEHREDHDAAARHDREAADREAAREEHREDHDTAARHKRPVLTNHDPHVATGAGAGADTDTDTDTDGKRHRVDPGDGARRTVFPDDPDGSPKQ